MAMQVLKLTKVLLCNIWGLNEIKHSKDVQKKRKMMLIAVTFGILGLFYMSYVVMISFAYIRMGLSDVIPGLMYTLVSILVLLFSIYKAGNVIFQLKSYEMLVSLPVSSAAVIISRFLTMYVMNLALSAITLLPMMAVYGYCIRPGAFFYVIMFLTMLLLPLFPMTLATAVGALILFISSKCRHKNIVNIILTLLLFIVIMVASMFTSNFEPTDMEVLFQNFSGVMEEQMSRIYPLSGLLMKSLKEADLWAYAKLCLISVGNFAVFIAVLQWKFVSICSALKKNIRKDNFRVGSLYEKSVEKALFIREFRQYISSPVYVTNTIIGYVMMILMAVAVLFIGAEKAEEMMQMQGILKRMAPMILGIAGIISPITASTVSIEGKHLWLIQSLPIEGKKVWNAKILLNLAVAFPFCFLSEILLAVSLKPGIQGGLWLFVIPFLYIVFSAVIGLFVNLKMPMLHWENETTVVKQSAAVLVSMLVNFACCAVPSAVLLIFPSVSANVIMAVTAILLFLLTAQVYRKILLFDIKSFG